MCNYFKLCLNLDKLLILVVLSKKMYRFRCLKVTHLVYFVPQIKLSGPEVEMC